MSQITLYLDDATEALVNQAAQASGLSKSRWVAELIRRHANDQWPQECRRMAGAFADFPLRGDEASDGGAQDLPRIGI